MIAISGIGIITALIYFVYLIYKTQKSFSDRILMVWMLVFSSHLTLPLMIALGNQFFIDKVDGLDIGLYTLHITFLYYYSSSITNHIKKFLFKHLLYLIPTALIYIIQNAIDTNIQYLKDLIEAYFYNNEWLFHLSGVVTLNMVFCVYFADKIFRLLSEHRKNVKNNFSYNKNVDLQWLKNMNIAALIMTVMTVFFLFGILKGILSGQLLNNIYFSLISIFAISLGYWGLKQKRIFSFVQPKGKLSESEIHEENQQIQKRSNPIYDFNPSATKDIETLLNFMKEEKPYLDSDLNIGILANKLNLHSHQLSKYINNYFNKNFFEFINDYRIDEFKKLIANPKNKNYSIIGIAFDAGFCSKATFNRIFKNATGTTPSQYRKKIIEK